MKWAFSKTNESSQNVGSGTQGWLMPFSGYFCKIPREKATYSPLVFRITSPKIANICETTSPKWAEFPSTGTKDPWHHKCRHCHQLQQSIQPRRFGSVWTTPWPPRVLCSKLMGKYHRASWISPSPTRRTWRFQNNPPDSRWTKTIKNRLGVKGTNKNKVTWRYVWKELPFPNQFVFSIYVKFLGGVSLN